MKLVITLILLGASALYAEQKPKPAQAPAAEPAKAEQAPAVPPTVPAPPAGTEKVTPKAPYDSTKAQLWAEKQKNLQLQAVQAKSQFEAQLKDLGDKYNTLTQSLDAWIGAVRTANGWDDSYTWDRESDTWTHTPKPTAPPTAPPPADPVKK